MPELGEPLSQREIEVLECVADGASNKEIAASLTISRNTVKVHMRNIFTKLGVSSRTEAITAAIQRGFVSLPQSPPVESPVPVADAQPADGTTGSDPLATDVYLSPEVTEREATSADGSSTAARQRRKTVTSSLPRLRRAIFFFSLVVGAVIVGWLGIQVLNDNQEAAAEPFVPTSLGDTGWFENRPMPAGQANMAVAAIGLNVYQIGGETDGGVVDSVRLYDTTGHEWHSAVDKPTAVADASAAVLFGEIYVPGGRLADGNLTDTVEVYSPTNDAWRPVAALPQPIAGGLSLSDGSFLYVFGGWDGERYLDTTYVYDVGADSWRPLPPMAQSRAFAAGSFVTGRLYVVGGFDGNSEIALCEFLDATMVQWSDCPDMLLPRGGAGAAVVLNKLYVIGGGLKSEGDIGFSEVYDPNSENWQVVNTPMLSQVPSWVHLGVVNVEVRIYALGGLRGEMRSPANYVYAPPVYKSFIPAATSGDGN